MNDAILQCQCLVLILLLVVSTSFLDAIVEVVIVVAVSRLN